MAEPGLGLAPLVSYTTRPIREGEVDGETYHFTDEAGLKSLQEQGKVIEVRCYQTVCGPWYYFTADDGSVEAEGGDRLYIGTLVSYEKLRDHFGEDRVCPIYIEVEDRTRLERSIARESRQKTPRYEEVCRRFLADQEDFAEEKLAAAGIGRRFSNQGEPGECLEQVRAYIWSMRESGGISR